VVVNYRTCYALHAKQRFEFQRPIVEDQPYTIIGRMTDVYPSHDIDYLTIEATLADHDGAALIYSYTRVFCFRSNGHPDRPPARPRSLLPAYLRDQDPCADASFQT
jgi:hypothetical protein